MRLLIVISLLLLSACSNPVRLVNQWTSLSHVPSGKMAIIKATKNEGVRRMVEAGLAKALAQYGVLATPTFDILETDSDISPKSLSTVLRKESYDSSLVVRLVRVDSRTEAIPRTRPPHFYHGYYYPHGPFWHDYHFNSVDIVQYEVATMSVDLFQLSSGELLWSGLFEVPSGIYSERSVHFLGKRIGKEFTRKKPMTIKDTNRDKSNSDES